MTPLHKDLVLLGRAGMADEDIVHAMKVRELALKLATRITKQKVDVEFIGRAALVHDLGKIVTDSILHGVEGARLGAFYGLEPALCDCMERHVRAGVPLNQCEAYGLPPKDYQAVSLEDRLVIVADKLTDILEAGLADNLEEAWVGFATILSAHPKMHKDEATLARYLQHARLLAAAMEHPYA